MASFGFIPAPTIYRQAASRWACDGQPLAHLAHHSQLTRCAEPRQSHSRTPIPWRFCFIYRPPPTTAESQLSSKNSSQHCDFVGAEETSRYSLNMLDFFALDRPKDKTPRATASVASLSGSQLSSSAPQSEQVQLENIESEKKQGLFSRLFSRPFTRRRIVILSALGFLIVTFLVLVITLPIVLTRLHKHKDPGDVYQLYPTKHEDPSYRILENKPVYAIHNFPDPGLLNHNGTWYAYGTNPHKRDPLSIRVPVATSTDFVNWTLHEGYDAMPTLGNWEVAQNHWAPDVIERVSSSSCGNIQEF